MARFYGRVGFTQSQEYPPGTGVWQPVCVPKYYYGDVERRWSRSYSPASNTVGDVGVTNVISIIADPFATTNAGCIRWVEWLGTKWEVKSIDVEFPRMKLTLGSEYKLTDIEVSS